MLFMTDIQSIDESLIETPEFEEWATDPKNMAVCRGRDNRNTANTIRRHEK